MDEEDAAADPYLPYDGGGDTIPLQEIPKRGMPYPVIHFSSRLFSSVGFLHHYSGRRGSDMEIMQR